MEKLLRQKLSGGKFLNVNPARSKTMSAIRGKNNKTTDRRLRMALIRHGIRGWSANPKNVSGSPDIYFPRKATAIFVDGCFWHGCPMCGHIPKTRTSFWATKIRRNKERDRKTNHELKSRLIKVVRIWEHQLRSATQVNKVVNKIFPSLSIKNFPKVAKKSFAA